MAQNLETSKSKPILSTTTGLATLSAVFLSGWSSMANAASVDAVSFLSVQHGFIVSNGAVPAGIASSTGGPMLDGDRDSMIGAADATLAVDTSEVAVGCVGCDPSIPYTHVGQHRTNRADPTEFADAQFDISALAEQDAGPDVVGLAMGERDVTRSGLAQARITSSPAPASAQSAYSISRTTTFENITDAEITFTIGGYFDAYLLSRYTGDDGFASTTTAFEILFSGVADTALSYLSIEPYAETTSETGDGATVTESLFNPAGGVAGMQFTASATALSGPGLTEASLNAQHEYLMFLTLLPGQTAEMAFGFSQQNEVSFSPVTVVPLPASLPLLAFGLAGLVLAARRSHL